MTTPNIEEVLNKLDVICKQADQYQISAGYPVTTTAKEILRTVLTTALQQRDEEETNNLQAVMDTVVMLHEQEEMTDGAFCKLRDLLHGIALKTPLP